MDHSLGRNSLFLGLLVLITSLSVALNNLAIGQDAQPDTTEAPAATDNQPAESAGENQSTNDGAAEEPPPIQSAEAEPEAASPTPDDEQPAADQPSDSEAPAEAATEQPAADDASAAQPDANAEADPASPDADEPTADLPTGDDQPVEPKSIDDFSDPLARQAIAAKDQFRPITSEQVQQARQQTQQAAANLERIFIRGDDLYERTWKEFLRWDDLQAGLAADQPDYAALSRVHSRFRINIAGNELSRFTRTRDALERYLNLSYGSAQENLEETYRQILDRLAVSLQQHAEEPSTDQAEEIGRLLGWLNRYDQAPELSQAINARYSQPNLFAEASEAFVAAGMQQDVNRETNVVQCILGTAIRGRGFTVGATTVELVPNDRQAQLNFVLSGATDTRNVGVNGPVTIYSNAHTTFTARLPLMFDTEGLSTGIATASANANSQITGIAANMRLIRHIASKRAYANKARAESIASAKAARRVADELNEESTGLVGDANDNYDEKFRDPLVRRGAFPRVLNFRTDASRLYVESVKDGPSQLGAFNRPPELNGSRDVSLRFHESAVSNYAEQLIGGETLTDEKLVELIEESGREVPEELRITPESDPWSITFADDQPVSVRLADNSVRIAIRGRRFTRQDQAITKAAAISAVYTVEKTPAGAKLIRQGDVQVDYLSRGRQTFAETAFKAFLTNKFEAMFKPEFEFTGLELPGRFAKVGTLHLQQLEVDGAWAAFGWDMPGEGAE